MITPISNNILIEPITEPTAFSTAQVQYEERGRVIKTSSSLVAVDDIVYFDSWQAARFKDGEGKDIWLVHIDAVRAVENL